MTLSNPAENQRGVADERAVRSFLEHAAPIILESRDLEGERFEAVCALADEHALTRDQLACELRLLEQRGVIVSAPWDLLDEVAEAPEAISPAPMDGTTRVAAKKRRPRDSSAVKLRDSKRVAQRREEFDISTTAAAVEALRERALKIIARRGMLSPQTLKKLQKAGKQAGLSKAQIAEVLSTLPPAPPTPGAVRGSMPGQPTAPPPATAKPAAPAEGPAAPSPSESFRRWIDQKLSGYATSILSMDDENGLVGVGMHRYHLAQVLSTHVVRDVATEHGIRLERDLDGASCNSTVGGSAPAAADDRKLQEFFEQVAPILTQHRGINAKSRVMMNAVAQRLGLTEGELEQALATLQRRARDPDEDDPRQLERRESFRAYLRRTMAQLPHGIITFKAQWRLCQAGEHFHGVAPKWIESTIKEVASEIGARFISKEQAAEHVKKLVEDRLTDRPVIDNATRSRIYTEGTQWGLDPMDVDTIIRERSEALRRQLAAERRRTRWVINFVIGGLVVAGVAVGMLVLLQPFSRRPTPQETEAAGRGKTVAPPPQLLGMPWWDDNLRIAQARLRVTSPDLRPVLDQMNSKEPGQRSQAYRDLVAELVGIRRARNRRDDVQLLLSSLYAREPSDNAANALSGAVLSALNSYDESLPEDASTIDEMFAGCQLAVSMIKDPDTPTMRRNRLIEQLDTASQAKGDSLLEADQLEQFYGAALSKRLYHSLIRLATDDPTSAQKYYGTISGKAQRYLDDTELDRQEVDLLAAILPALGDNWDHFAGAIRHASRSADPNTVIKLLAIYRRSEDDRLKDYLAGLFYERLGSPADALTVEDIINGVRESLGIASREREYRRWKMLTDTADELLNRKRVENTSPDVLMQETIELAHAATLACALSRGESGGPTFDEMQSEGPVKLALSGGPWNVVPSDEYRSTYPIPRTTVLEKNIENLISARTLSQRSGLMRMIANMTDSVPDIDLESGQRLARYLAKLKSDVQEHQLVMSYAKQLATWNAVRIGLADQVRELSGRDSQIEQLLSEVLEQDVDLSSAESREKVSAQLLAQVLNRLSETPVTDDSKFRVFDEADKALLDLYSRQAKLIGLPLEAYSSAGETSALVAALIGYLSEQLRGKKLDAEDRTWLDSLTYQLRAADFVAQNDLQYTAALQEIWLRLLALHVMTDSPETKSAVRRVLDESRESAAAEPRVFEQLRDLQISMLKVWMQLQPSFEGLPLEEKYEL